jgi:hypothetical protein
LFRDLRTGLVETPLIRLTQVMKTPVAEYNDVSVVRDFETGGGVNQERVCTWLDARTPAY